MIMEETESKSMKKKAGLNEYNEKPNRKIPTLDSYLGMGKTSP